MKKIIIALLIISGGIFTSCEDISSANVSKVTDYPIIDVLGDDPMFIPLGGSYTDPGAVATEGENEIEYTTSAKGNFRGASSVDTNTADEYVVTYSAVNVDGFFGTATRKVIVYKTGDLVNSIEGVYRCTIARNGSTPSAAYRNIEYIYIWKNTDGSYGISDAFGGWYSNGRGLGLTYITPGGKIVANNIAANDFSFPGTLTNSGFGGSAQITGLTVNPTTKTVVLTCVWQADATTTYNFVATLTQVQL